MVSSLHKLPDGILIDEMVDVNDIYELHQWLAEIYLSTLNVVLTVNVDE
jgi:hypothetical protein